jgi:ABC-2 type transport system permease protein
MLKDFKIPLSLTVLALVAAYLLGGVKDMLIVAVLSVLATGLAMLLSSLFVYFRDIEPIWEVITQILFYVSPVIIPFYEVQKHLSATLAHLYLLSPLASALQQFRHAVVTPDTPSVAQALGSHAAVLEPLAVVVVIFAVGFYVFNRTAPHVAENL